MNYASDEMIDWKGIRIPCLTFHEIHSSTLYLLRILSHPDGIIGDGRAHAIELTSQLCRSLYGISAEAFIHAVQASHAIQRFLADSNQITRCSTEDHLLAIRTILSLDELFNQESHQVLGQGHLLSWGGNQ